MNFTTTSDSTVLNHSATTLPDGDFDDFAIADEEEDQQVPGNRWFLTFPQNSLPRQQAWRI